MKKGKKFLILPVLKQAGFELDEIKTEDAEKYSISYYILLKPEIESRLIVRIFVRKDPLEMYLQFYTGYTGPDPDITKGWMPIMVKGKSIKEQIESFLKFARNNNYIL